MDSSIASGSLLKVYNGILEAVQNIAEHLRYNTSNKITSNNEFGDVQLDMDVQTDSIIFDCLRETGAVFSGLSEERAYITYLCEEGEYIVTFDPLDGSSIVDTNFTVGSIFAIWPKGDLNKMTGRDIVGGALALYGSRTNCIVYNTNQKTVDEVTLQKLNEDTFSWVVTQKNIRIRPQGKFFSPGNTRSIQDNKGYRDAVEFWQKNGYVLRYSGGMAPDCYHVFIKGEGIFSSVCAEGKISSKLRLLYECAPIAFLCEKAGGLSSDGFRSVLDIPVDGFTQKVDIIIGSKEEVERTNRFLQAHKRRKVSDIPENEPTKEQQNV